MKRNKEVIAKLSAAHQRFIAKLANSSGKAEAKPDPKQAPSDNPKTS